MTQPKTDNYGWGEAPPQSAGFLNDPIRALVRSANATDVLDAGCGNGAMAGDLAKDGYNVVGVDGDAHGIAVARRLYPGVRFEQADFADDVTALGLTADGRFDAVVSTEVVEHLYQPEQLVQFCFNALRPGGMLFMSTPYHGYAKNLAISLTNKWDFHFSPHWTGGHIKFWSRRTLTDLLESHGFKVTGFTGVGRAPFLWKSMILHARRPA